MIPKTKINMHVCKSISQLTIQEKKSIISDICEDTLIDPQTAFSALGTNMQTNATKSKISHEVIMYHIRSQSKISHLLVLGDPTKNGNDEYTARLACLSLLAIFQDILPAYYIRLPTVEERAVRVSKDTKKIWDYERALLFTYYEYLKLLELLWIKGVHKFKGTHEACKGHSILAITAILCLCELLKSASHFNYRYHILSLVIREMNNNLVEEVSISCCEAISFIFETDQQGDITLEATRMIYKLVKNRTCSLIKPQILMTFLLLPLRYHEDGEIASGFSNVKKVNKMKIYENMKEDVATMDKISLAHSQSETLKFVTMTYLHVFRGLEENSKCTSNIVSLLPPVLRGLTKFRNLINFDKVTDFSYVIIMMLKKCEQFPLDVSINCILTSFLIFQNPGRELQIDQKVYITALYCQIPRLIVNNDPKCTDIVLKSLFELLIRRKEYSNVIIGSFVKMISTVALHVSKFTSVAIISFLRNLLKCYPYATQMLESEHDIISSGVFIPNFYDPEQTNPFATSLWELSTLCFHVQPNVSIQSIRACTQETLNLPVEDPTRLHNDLISQSENFHIKYSFNKKSHPLTMSLGKKYRKTNIHVKFITPRETGNLHLKPI